MAESATPDGKPLSSHDPRTVGPYRLIGRLGAGGQGVVYLGMDAADHRVAVKIVNVDLRHSPKAKSQFAKEIAAARRVAPFCTAQVLFTDVDSDPPYVVSEYIEGPTLQWQVRRHGPISGNALHRLAVGTATALAAIHRADVVHCDFKPDNVILGSDGPRVIDFGIARALDVAETATRGIMGTAPYMAPERFHNADVGPRCDVFAWAATIAFAAAGRPPFGNDSIASVMYRVLNEPPELQGLSGALDELIRDCLRKDQHARPRADEVLLRLLGHTDRPSASLPLESMLQEGTDAATSVIPSPPIQVTEPPAAGPQPRPQPWSQRMRRQYGDPWGIATAVLLCAVGAAAGYVASAAAVIAAAIGAVTFVVVYTVRLLTAAALDAEGGHRDPITMVLRSGPGS